MSTTQISRRSFVGKIAAAGAAGAAGSALVSQFAASASERPPELPSAEQGAIEKIAREFLQRFKVPGMAIAVSHDGKLVLNRGFGVADETTGAAVTPEHLFRIASVSKPITSVTVFKLIEQGRLGLDDLVFGEKGRLGSDFGAALPERVREITVRHLLTHTCGGWQNKAADPMFMHPAMGHRELIAWAIANQPLAHAPGTSYAYSNFGYCILGRVIEKITGQPYAQAVQRMVLGKCGVHAMRIASNTRAERQPDEVTYYSSGAGDPYGMNVARMDSHGGWLARASDLVQFALRVDAFPNPPDILREETLRTMTTHSALSESYACGWAVNKAGHWWHNGSLPGTASILVRTSSGLCWAGITNSRGPGLDTELDHMIWRIARAVPDWRA